jgi:nucleoside-diphosphate-sugar epimerase
LRKIADYSLTLFGNKRTFDNEFFEFRLPNRPIKKDRLLEFDTIIYTASAGVQSSKSYSPDLIYGVNTFEPIAIINFLKINGYRGKFISFGSYFEIGSTNDELVFQEEDIVKAIYPVPNDYCISKRILTRFIHSQSLNFTLYHLILSTIYGSGEDQKRLIPYLITSIKDKTPIALSSGEQIRNYIFVDDVVELILDILNDKSLASGVFNVCGDQHFSIKEIATKVIAFFNSNVVAEFGTVSRQDQSMKMLCVSNKKVKSTFNWRPKISIEEGISKY